MILIFFFFVQKTPLLNTVYPWGFFSHVTKVREMCIFFSLCQSIFLRFKTFLIANNTVNHRKITRYTVFINMIMMVRYMQMFYLVGTSTIANSACLCHQHLQKYYLCDYSPYYRDHLLVFQQHNNTCIFDRCFVLFGKHTTLFGDLTIQSRLHPNMIHEICHVNNGLNLIKAYECQQIYVTNVG